MPRKIVFTGGGSGGHVMPALTLIKELEKDFDIFYIGSYNGIERELANQRNIPYKAIPTGKLRRYFSFQNFTDLFRVLLGIVYSFIYLAGFSKDTLVFSTGGFVTVPVVFSAWLQRKQIVLHEQTSRAGLANKISALFANQIFISFEASRLFFPDKKTVFSGYPVKQECFDDKIRIQVPNLFSLDRFDRPLILITGGGNGSSLLNNKIKNNLIYLQKHFYIIHQAGNNFYKEFKQLETPFYRVFSFIGDEMIDLYKSADIIICRAGAGTVSELMTLGKSAIFVPLKIAQKNEQYHNAMESCKIFGSTLFTEDEFADKDISSIINFHSSTQEKKSPENPYRKIRAVKLITDYIKIN